MNALITKVTSGSSLVLGLLLLVFFFLPWVNLTCAGTPIGKASGWQLTTGDLSKSEQMQEMNGGTPQAETEDDDDGPDPRPWFILGLLVPIGIGLVGAKGLMGHPMAKALIVLGIIGAVVMVLVTTVDYGAEMKADAEAKAQVDPNDPGAAMGQQMGAAMAEKIDTETTGIVWVSLVLYLLVIGCGVVMMLMAGRPAIAARPGPVSAAPPTGTQPAPPVEPEVSEQPSDSSDTPPSS
jgi:hypothetical protein